MSIFEILIISIGLTAFLALIWMALSGPDSAKSATRRLQALRFRHSDSATAKVEAQMRKAVAARAPSAHQLPGSQSRIAALSLRLYRTGKSWTIKQYVQASVGLTVVVAGLVYVKSGTLLLALAAGIVVGAGFPHWWVGKLIKKRGVAFTSKFADAIDLLVRGLRSGLPVTETLGVVAREIPGPVGQEFKLITERIKIGRTMDEALQETADRLNMQEFNFFCVTLAIQRETGGNLAETLANLANVLRMRAQMKLKIKALSSEAKASAWIVGSLPFVVFIMIEWVNAPYLAGFFKDDRLIACGIGGGVWMGMGVFIMAKMCNFEF